MNMRKRQSGMTMISWVILIGLIGFVGIFGFDLMPIYMEYNSINSALTTVSKGVTAGETPAQVRVSIGSLFDVNSIADARLNDVDVKVDPDTKAIELDLDYEARTKFIANIFLVVHFQKTYTAGH